MAVDLVKQFHDFVTISIQKKGIYPFPMISVTDEDLVEMGSLALNTDECYMHFCTKTLNPKIRASIFGLDRTAHPGQGTEFADVLTCVLYERVAPDVMEYRVRQQFRVGVINYQHKPRIVRPMDWENAFWIKMVQRELFQFVPPMLITLKKKEPTA